MRLLVCDYDGCTRTRYNGERLCPTHARKKRAGKLDEIIMVRGPARVGPCSFDGCGRKPVARGLCGQHYRQKRMGVDLTPIRSKAPDGTGWINAEGYHEVGGKLTHRVVMERRLGRALLPGETVHHKNGIRHDNEDKNLELWVTQQPSGQRVSDRVRDAVEILERYAPHLLSRIVCEEA